MQVPKLVGGPITGVLATALGLALLAACPATNRPASRPDIVLITLDTTRADHLGPYGYRRETSPALDRLAADSIVYTSAYSVSSWTLPAHASLFTGDFPSSHGATWNPEGELILGEGIAGPGIMLELRAGALSGARPTLAEALREAGYDTGAVVAGPWLKRIFGLDRGFASYDDSEINDLRGRRARSVTDSAIQWLDKRAERPSFLFLNYYDPHGPYSDPEGLGTRFGGDDELARYDGEILYMDRQIGRLLDWMRTEGRYDSSWIIVTADHGELFGEHGKNGHGEFLFEPEIRVPLIVKLPAGESSAGRSSQPVQLTQIVPWIAKRVGLPGSRVDRGAIFAEVYPHPLASRFGDWRVLIDPPYKLHWNSLGNHRMYDLSADPDETSNLFFDRPERAAAMLAAIEEFRSLLPAPPQRGAPIEIDRGTRDELESLGYLPRTDERKSQE